MIGNTLQIYAIQKLWRTQIVSFLGSLPIVVTGSPFNAKGDGIADDGPAFNLALAAGTIVYVPPGTYKIATAVSVPANTALILAAGVILNLSAAMTFGNSSALIGPATAANTDLTSGIAVINQISGSNLAHMLIASGAYVSFSGFIIDGNKAGNSSGGSNIYVTGNRAGLSHLTTRNAKTHGIEISSTGTTDGASVAKLDDVVSCFNGAHGLAAVNTADIFIDQCEFESNGSNGIDANNSPTMRLSNSDSGGNVRGFYAYGAAFNPGVSLGSQAHIITGCQFGNNSQEDIFLDGTAGGTYGNTITGNSFIGSQFRTSNTYSCIKILDNAAGVNVVCGNMIISPGGFTFKYGVEVAESVPGGEGWDSIGPNNFGGTFGTSAFTGTGKTVFISVDGTTGISQIYNLQRLHLSPVLFASLPTPTAALAGSIASVADSTTIVWGATIIGGGGSFVMALCTGANWTVMGL